MYAHIIVNVRCAFPHKEKWRRFSKCICRILTSQPPRDTCFGRVLSCNEVIAWPRVIEGLTQISFLLIESPPYKQHQDCNKCAGWLGELYAHIVLIILMFSSLLTVSHSIYGMQDYAISQKCPKIKNIKNRKKKFCLYPKTVVSYKQLW